MCSLSRIKKAVVLLSGGIDSATVLYFAQKKGYSLEALIFDYGQRHRREIESAKKIAKIKGVSYRLQKIDLSWAQSSLVDTKIKVPVAQKFRKRNIPSTYVSGRNIIFLSYASSLAESIGASKIFIGAHTEDYSGYPDCRPEFIESFEKAIKLGLGKKNINISTPLIAKDKEAIIKLGLKLGVPFESTWSCYGGGKKPCLKCDSCWFRTKAFNKIGMIDPILKK